MNRLCEDSELLNKCRREVDFPCLSEYSAHYTFHSWYSHLLTPPCPDVGSRIFFAVTCLRDKTETQSLSSGILRNQHRKIMGSLSSGEPFLSYHIHFLAAFLFSHNSYTFAVHPFRVYSSVIFSIFIELYIYHCDQF